MFRVISLALVCASGLAAIVGCGDKSHLNRPKTVPASVVVIYRGQPVSGATVTFHPGASQQRGASSITDDDGQAEMWAYEPGDGVIPGAYKVTVSKVAVAKLPDPDAVSPEEYRKAERALAKQSPKHELPEKYSRVDKTSLTVDVAEDGDNEVTLELTD